MARQLDSEIRTLLDTLAEQDLPEKHTLSVEDARALMNDQYIFDDDRLEAVGTIEDRTVPGCDGAIPVRTYTPDGEGPFPVLVYYHGGGWVVSNLDTYDALCRALANQADCVVVSVDYRRAPESPFPAPVRDCYDATTYVAANPTEFGGRDGRVAIGGDSAGGNLAAAVTLLARDQDGPELAHQLLIYPVTNHDFETDSYRRCAEGYGLSRADMMWFWDHYLQDDIHGKNPYASPLQARDLNDLPPATVITAGFDPLLDEGAAYADRLRNADVDVAYHEYEGAIHGFVNRLVEPDLPQARNAIRAAATDLQRSLSQSQTRASSR